MPINKLVFRQFIKGRFHYWGFTDDGTHFVEPLAIDGVYGDAMGKSDRPTGLVDKNGIGIFENDLIKYTSQDRKGNVLVENAKVYWDDKATGFSAVANRKDQSDGSDNWRSPHYGVEQCNLMNIKGIIIGNLHQNSDLY